MTSNLKVVKAEIAKMHLESLKGKTKTVAEDFLGLMCSKASRKKHKIAKCMKGKHIYNKDIMV